MDSRSTTAEPNQSSHPVASCWAPVSGISNALHTPRTPGSASTTSSASTFTSTYSEPTAGSPYPSNLDLLAPLLFSQHQAQLLHYNKLISPGRGGGFGLQPIPLAGLPSVPSIQAAPRSRSRSSSKVSNKDGHSLKQSPAAQNCHGTRGFKNKERQDREGMTMEKDKGTTQHDKGKPKGKEPIEKPPLKVQPEMAHALPSRPARGGPQGQQQLHTTSTAHASSVPSTPQQRPRNFSFASRDASPTATQLPSPRSIYSEPHGGVPARQPLRVRPCPRETAQFFQRRRMPYSLGPGSVEKVDPKKIKSELSEEEERKLSTDMREVYNRILPSPEVEKNRETLVTKLEKIFNDEWPGHDIRVHRFGSSGNLLCSDDSDVDICITTDWKEIETVCYIADLLARHGYEKVVCVSGAKVPIVKVWDPELNLHCDMNVNNTLALENTRMIRTYVQIDKRVRPLAMVIKYWTRRRVLNDAAYGMTLSSYTWICMIVAFLQLRDPPVLPALHQLPHLKLPTTDGHTTEFADDLDQLKGWGKKNKSTIGELLFQFFRFFAYEFDYDNQVLSVRLGKLIHKNEKKEREWQHMNNYICVEEPFNKVRNLGNTADEFSFRGLQMEMRRAFDLVAAAKLDECCEQFVMPKQEKTESSVFVKPSARPAVMLRSASQTQPGRGGRNGGRGNRNNNYRNGNSSRRASSSNAYENQPTSAPASAAGTLPHPLLGQTREMSAADVQQWQLAQHFSYPANIAMLSTALMAQQDRYHQAWNAQQAQLHAVAQAQRAQGHAASAGRSRTNSFDQPPLTATRPEFYHWPTPQMQQIYAAHAAAAQYQHHGFGTYPSSPSTVPEGFRRSLHRTNAANDGGSSNGGTLRSQSQPASRTPAPGGQPGSSYAASAQTANGVSGYAPRPSMLSPFPLYAADDRSNSEADDISNRTLPDSPEDDTAGHSGYFPADTSPRKSTHGVPASRDASVSSASRRRMSTEGPQAVLDRRLRRTSRSPSPAGHGRNVIPGPYSAPLSSGSFPQNGNRSTKESSPLVVNGSTFMPAPTTWSQVTGDTAYENPLHITHGCGANGAMDPDGSATSSSDRPLVVNGSSAKSSDLSRNTVAGSTSGTSGQRPAVPGGPNGVPWAKVTAGDAYSNHRGKAQPRVQSGIASLDLAVHNPGYPGPQHLSPVYEMRTPTPTVSRDRPFSVVAASSDARVSRPVSRPAERNGTTKEGGSSTSSKPDSARVNGHASRESVSMRAPKVDAAKVEAAKGEAVKVEAAKVEAEWQQPKARKKQPTSSKPTKPTPPQSEKPPRDFSERKGG